MAKLISFSMSLEVNVLSYFSGFLFLSWNSMVSWQHRKVQPRTIDSTQTINSPTFWNWEEHGSRENFKTHCVTGRNLRHTMQQEEREAAQL